MEKYYLSTAPQQNGEYDLHVGTCNFLPAMKERIFVGEFSNFNTAMKEARKRFKPVNGCYWCLRECHTPQTSNPEKSPT
ncbi:MAG: hypothetical protein ABW089_14745 [Sedimenticola sp.]